jgi:transcriptional regulator with XRE-family HTH domain
MNNERDPSTEPNDANAIGARVRELRLQKGLSLSELAQQANVSKSYLSTVENGTGSRPGAAVLHKLAITLGVSLADLLGRSVQATDPDEAIPSSLQEFAQQQGLPQADIDMLAGIKFRGEAPRTPERWQFIYNAIVMSAKSETDSR